jgi:hypothetical protein
LCHSGRAGAAKKNPAHRLTICDKPGNGAGHDGGA